jgi:hypothetical protein
VLNAAILYPRFVLNGCQPRTLASLLDLQECSYRRLLRLAPDLARLQGTAVSRVAGAMDLYLTLVERQRYTTTLSLTYRFPCAEGCLWEPNVNVRVYHDARLAEAVSYSRRHPPRNAPCRRRPVPTELETKWETNRFLQRWLGYCLRQGHLFLERDGATRDAIAPTTAHAFGRAVL